MKGSPNVVEITFVCPFCGLGAGVTQDHESLVHALPMCERFEQLDVIEYLSAVNEARAARIVAATPKTGRPS